MPTTLPTARESTAMTIIMSRHASIVAPSPSASTRKASAKYPRVGAAVRKSVTEVGAP